jgi:hypothetical protein
MRFSLSLPTMTYFFFLPRISVSGSFSMSLPKSSMVSGDVPALSVAVDAAVDADAAAAVSVYFSAYVPVRFVSGRCRFVVALAVIVLGVLILLSLSSTLATLSRH